MSDLSRERAAAYQAVRALIAKDPSSTATVLAAMTDGQNDHIDTLRTKLSDATNALVAAVALTNERATPSLKKHLERTLVRHFKPNVEMDCQAVRDFVARAEDQPHD